MNNTTNKKKVIWTGFNVSLPCVKALLKADNPDISDEELTVAIYEANFGYFEKLSDILSLTALEQPIIAIVNYKDINDDRDCGTDIQVIDSGNLSECLDYEFDLAEWYVDENGDFCSYGINRDYVFHTKYFAIDEDAPLSALQHLFVDVNDEDFDFGDVSDMFLSIGDDVLYALKHNRCLRYEGGAFNED